MTYTSVAMAFDVAQLRVTRTDVLRLSDWYRYNGFRHSMLMKEAQTTATAASIRCACLHPLQNVRDLFQLPLLHEP